MVTISSAKVAPARFTSASTASDSRLTEPVIHHAPVFNAIVASATATDNFRYALTCIAAESCRAGERTGRRTRSARFQPGQLLAQEVGAGNDAAIGQADPVDLAAGRRPGADLIDEVLNGRDLLDAPGQLALQELGRLGAGVFLAVADELRVLALPDGAQQPVDAGAFGPGWIRLGCSVPEQRADQHQAPPHGATVTRANLRLPTCTT